MKTAIKLSILALVIFTASCKKETDKYSSSPTAIPESSVISANSSLDDVNLINENLVLDPNISIGTEDQDFYIADDGMGDETELGNNAKGHRPLCFIHCLKKQQLDSNQAHALHNNFIQLANCKMAAVKRIRAINDSIIHHANNIKKHLIQDYKDGKITKVQLRNSLEKLNKHTHGLLMSNFDRKILIKQLVNCHNTFKINLGKILNAAQIKAFKACLLNC